MNKTDKINFLNSPDRVVRVTLIAFCAVVWLMLSFYEYALLARVDARSLFLFDELFFWNSVKVPAGFLGYVGCFLTQFFYYPPLGAAIFVALLAVVFFLVRKAFRIPSRWAMLAMLPLFFLLATDTQLGYWIYYIKFPGFWYVPVLGTIAALSAIWLFNKASYKLHIPVIVLWTLFGYPLFGFYALFSAVCMAVISCSMALRNGNRMRIVFDGVAVAVVALALFIEVPLFWYEYYSSTALEFVHTAGLPTYHWDITADHFIGSIILYWIPYLLLFVSMLIFSAIYNMLPSKGEADKRYMAVNGAVLAAALLFAWCYWYDDTNFRIENKQDLAMWNGEWRDVADYARDTDEPSRQIVMNKNIALLNLGTAGDEMFKYPDGSALIDAPMKVHLNNTGGIMSYYCYGKFNFAYRWCVENAVEFGWKAEYLKHAVRSMLLQGEYKIAERYINILRHTLFHKEWAEHYSRFLDNPDAVAKEKEFVLPLQMCIYPDFLDVDESFIEAYLIKSLSSSNFAENSFAYGEAALMATLIRKDSKLFWLNLSRYLHKRQLKRLPIHYQEAVVLFQNLDRSVDASNLPINQAVRLRFDSFMRRSKKYKGQKEEEMAPHFKEDFGDTYWYFYFFVRNIKTN